MSPRGVPVDPAKRADRILDAAARLLLRYGYNRTTISDVAREAGVAKGSVYAHWRSRELLFRAVLHREHATLLARVRDRLRTAGRPADLKLLLRESVQAYEHSPIIIAALTHNSEILGGLVRTATEEGSRQGVIVELLVTLRASGWIRTDRTLAEQVTVLSAMYLGYLLTKPQLPGEFRIPDDTVPDLVADTVRYAIQRPEPLTPDELAAVDRAVRDHISAAAAAAEHQLRHPHPLSANQDEHSARHDRRQRLCDGSASTGGPHVIR